MLRIKKIIFKIKFFINSLYYFRFSIIKNIYPYKLIGEEIDHLGANKIILYRVLGQEATKKIYLNKLLDSKKLIEKFHPTDAIKLGAIAFEDIILSFKNDERKEKFNQIKNAMLSSTHDIYPRNKQPTHQQSSPCDEITDVSLDFVTIKNHYPCKLVGAKLYNAKISTIVIFTILGKRDGYKKPLQELLHNKELLEKFHPTEAVKFGFGRVI